MYSMLLLLGAAATVAILHSILPDHWVPLAIVARTQRWNILRVARVSFLASIGHVVSSLLLGGIIALIGLQFQKQIDTQQGHIIGGVLFLTGLIFLIWGFVNRGHGHTHSSGVHDHDHEFAIANHDNAHDTHNHEHDSHDHDHDSHDNAHDTHNHDHDSHDNAHDSHDTHDHDHKHAREHDNTLPARAKSNNPQEQSLAKRISAIVVPFGVAASPDLTILPVVLAASALGAGAIVGVLSVFAVLTIGTFVGLTVLATLAGYQIKGAWLENNANTITSLVLIGLGIVAFVGF